MSSDFSQNQKQDLIRRFPPIELSYETMAHKKVPPSYDICLAIPPGKKCFIWFSFLQGEDVCYLMEIGRDKKIGAIRIIGKNIPVKLALNTLFYGTLWEQENGGTYFLIEDIFYYHGISLKTVSFGEKLGFIDEFFKTYSPVLHICTSKTPTLSADLTGKGNSYHALEKCEGLQIDIPIFLPILWKKMDAEDSSVPLEWINKIPYSIHHLQYRSLNTISPYLNVSMTKKLSSQTTIDKTDEMLSFMIFPKPPFYDFAKPQYKFPTIFEVKADIQFDIYHLYAFGQKSKREYYGVAYIPNYRVSVFMNGIFRNIKENKNLDYIEESDDEDDFQDMRMDKYVDLKKMVTMECKFHSKFKRWVPLRVVKSDEKVIHIGRLIK